MELIIHSTFVVNRTDGVTTSLLVTLKAYEVILEEVDDKIVSNYDSDAVLGTREFTYNIPVDQQTDKVSSGGDSGYMEKVRAWIDTYIVGQDYITSRSQLESEVL